MRVSRCLLTFSAGALLWPGHTPKAEAQSASFTLAAEPTRMPKTPLGHEPATGAFSQSVAIEVPEFHGIAPSLALHYSSAGSGSFVGVGWQLSGFAVIERTRNGRGTPRFTASDVFALNGEELLACSSVPHSPGCSAGGTHATKRENYHRIAFNAASNSWTVTAKNGTRTVLGPVYQTAAGTWRWGQSRVIDTHGNAVNFVWAFDGSDAYLDQITYGAYVIRFFRETRPDVLSFATGGLGGIGKTLYRLRSVLVARGTTPIRAYRLGHDTSPRTGRSRLREVQAYGYDVQMDGAGLISGGTSLPPQVFGYQE